jgi:hypothetical protein
MIPTPDNGTVRRRYETEQDGEDTDDGSYIAPLPTSNSTGFLLNNHPSLDVTHSNSVSGYDPIFKPQVDLSSSVIVPKHLNYVSPQIKPNVAELISEEALVLLRVEAFAVALLFLVAAVMFAHDDTVVIILCVLGAIISLFGVQGSLRKYAPTIQIFWMGLCLWTLGAAMVLIYNLFINDTAGEAADTRCTNMEYVETFGTNCALKMHECILACHDHVKHHLIVSISVFGVFTCIVLAFFVYQARKLYKLIIFPEKVVKEEEEDEDDYDEDDEEHLD